MAAHGEVMLDILEKSDTRFLGFDLVEFENCFLR